MATDRLGVFLDDAFKQSFAWGKHDCILLPANWVKAVTGIDPARDWRGTYCTATGAARRLQRAGGRVIAVSDAMKVAKLHTTSEPVMGDVGLLRAVTDQDDDPALAGIVGGICLGRGFWTSLTADGLLEGKAIVIAAWSVGYRA